jgi:hypothetical protein
MLNTVNTKKHQKGANVKIPQIRFTVSLCRKEMARITKAQKETPIKNKTEFVRVLLREALTARGQ